MAVMLTASVGANGRNQSQDVMNMQNMLNKFITPGYLKPHNMLVPDGLCGNLTISAIRDFQRSHVGLASPDGRIDPGGRTLNALNGAIGPGTHGSASNSKTREWALALRGINSGRIDFELVNRVSGEIRNLVVQNALISSLNVSRSLLDKWILFSTSYNADFPDFSGKPMNFSKAMGGPYPFNLSIGSLLVVPVQTLEPNNGCLQDTCMPTPIPIPYPNLPGQTDNTKIVGVKLKGTPATLGTAAIGNTAATLKGLVSSSAMGSTKWILSSSNVMAEGGAVITTGSPMMSNSTAPLWSPPVPSQTKVLILSP